MPFHSAQRTQSTTHLVPYASATPRQRALVLYYLRQRLSQHFPTLSEAPWAEALDLFKPDLRVTDEAITLSYQDLTELVQHLATTPELPQLDPPIYGSQAICLAQQRLALEELAARAVAELASIPVASAPWLTELLSRLVRGSGIAQQVVQAVRWGVGVGRPLPAGLPGLGPTPGSPEVARHLRQLQPTLNVADTL